MRTFLLLLLSFSLTAIAGRPSAASELESSSFRGDLESLRSFVSTYCLDCHTSGDPAGELDLESLSFAADAFAAAEFDSHDWEQIWRRLLGRQMPPPDATRPAEEEYEVAITALDRVLRARAEAFPQPGRTNSLRRLTRTEYENAVEDLLAVSIDATTWLPADESSHGFDNITVSELSPLLINRYLSAAQQISRLAIGRVQSSPVGVTIRVPADRTQESHVEGLPLGTRGGVLFEHTFAGTGRYDIELRLTRDRDEKVEGLDQPHQIDVLIDRQRRHRFTVEPPPDRQDYTHADTHLNTSLQITAGTHQIGVTFPQTSDSLIETKRQPFDARFNRHRHPRLTPALFQVSIVGPLPPQDESSQPGAPASTASRQRIFVCQPDDATDQTECAEKILGRLMRLAYRRPVTDADLQSPMWFFEQGNREGGFEAGIEAALTAILVNPNFLFRLEQDPPDAKSGDVYAISDLELASRLSFLLWSSLPDDELLTIAESNRLRDPEVLAGQVQRMLADPRSESLATNFAAQWLYLRNLDSITPDLRLFPDFDDNLRQAFRRETELVFADMVARDRSVLSLIQSDSTFLNQRLATHYGIPHVSGSHFRPVQLPADSRRGGLLRHGSVLTVTSYATRTSPTIRGNWVLKNIVGTPPPPPPPNVPNLQEKATLEPTSVRERLAQHRADPACASCHDLMDPVGFAMENYDAVGRWRDFEDTLPIDQRGTLPDGSDVAGIDALEAGILKRPEMFVATLTERLLTFGLGRGIQPSDGPAIRQIVSAAAEQDYRFSAILLGIVSSDPFQMRSVP